MGARTGCGGRDATTLAIREAGDRPDFFGINPEVRRDTHERGSRGVPAREVVERAPPYPGDSVRKAISRHRGNREIREPRSADRDGPVCRNEPVKAVGERVRLDGGPRTPRRWNRPCAYPASTWCSR